MAALIKSKHRVKTYGEVFTPPHIVNKMLDLVQSDIDNVDATFLEPAAGDGNFLTAILRRKLKHIEKVYPKRLWKQESLFALASIYGIELLEDNFIDARYNMAIEFIGFHDRHRIPCGWASDLFRSARHIIDVNLVEGNTLTGQDWWGDPIVFSWWHRIPDQPGMVWREPFSFASLKPDAGLFDVGGFDFTPPATYEPCPISKVYQGVLKDG